MSLRLRGGIGHQTFGSRSDAALFRLQLSASEQRFAAATFAAKMALFWLSELVICQWDQEERWVGNMVNKSFALYLIPFALKDLPLVIPQIRRSKNH